MPDAVVHQLEKLVPGLRRVHAADDPLAIAQPVFQDDRGDSWIDAGGINGDAGAQARSAQRDAIGIDLRPRGHIAHRVARVGDFLHRNNAAAFSFALAASPIVKAERDVAPSLELPTDPFRATILVGAKPVHHDDGWAARTGLEPVGHMDDAGQLQAIR
jgi:hypothetical protein